MNMDRDSKDSTLIKEAREIIEGEAYRGVELTALRKITPKAYIYEFPEFGGIQLGLAPNKETLSLFVRTRVAGGNKLDSNSLQDLASIAQRYSGVERNANGKQVNPTSIFMQPIASGLNPSPENPLLRLHVKPERIRDFLELYLSLSVTAPQNQQSSPSLRKKRHQRAISPEELAASLDRRSEVGKRGEEIAKAFEERRVAKLRGGQLEKGDVTHISIENIAAGYDIYTRWPAGGERCIEVKTSTSDQSYMFISHNERETLEGLGQKGWLYFVDLRQGTQGAVVATVQNPIGKMKEEMNPVVWTLSAKVVKSYNDGR